MEPKINLLVLLVIAIGAGTVAEGQTPFTESTNAVVITPEFIENLMAEAQTNNPGLLAAGSRASSAAANAGSVRTWDDPTFLVGDTLFSPEGFDAAQEGNLTYGIAQKLPL